MRVLVAMSAVESVSGRLEEQDAALARELLWVSLDAVGRDDAAAVDEATGTMLRLAVRAARTVPRCATSTSADRRAGPTEAGVHPCLRTART